MASISRLFRRDATSTRVPAGANRLNGKLYTTSMRNGDSAGAMAASLSSRARTRRGRERDSSAWSRRACAIRRTMVRRNRSARMSMAVHDDADVKWIEDTADVPSRPWESPRKAWRPRRTREASSSRLRSRSDGRRYRYHRSRAWRGLKDSETEA